jgi:hypothetical protein
MSHLSSLTFSLSLSLSLARRIGQYEKIKSIEPRNQFTFNEKINFSEKQFFLAIAMK